MNIDLKGRLNGNCNRTDCQKPGATFFNTSTRSYYCESCAKDINRWACRHSGFPICFPSQGAKLDRAMKFGAVVAPATTAHITEINR